MSARVATTIRAAILAAVSMLALARSGDAQRRVPPAPHQTAPAPAAPGEELTVWLLTMGQGDEVWERFGHNGIRIRDARRGTDVTYNWGVFDFAEPGFLVRFLTGDTRYWLEGYPTELLLDYYRRSNRTVWAQELNLSPAQRLRLRDSVAWNARPENKYYRYDYFRDNCSTRVRDVIDRALAGQLRQATADSLTPTSFRWHTQRLLQDRLALYTGIEIALGQPADRPISVWETFFLPTRLQIALRDIQVQDASGGTVPLVRREGVLFQASRGAEPETVPDRVLAYVIAGVAIAVACILLARAAAHEGRTARRFLVFLIVTWSLLSSLIGGVLVIAWTATRHVFWAHNENLLLLSPLAVLLAITLPGAAAPSGRATVARFVATLVALSAAAALALKVMPRFGQTNGEIIALVLPVALAVSWSVGILTATARPRRAAPA